MTVCELTGDVPAATTPTMKGRGKTKQQRGRQGSGRRAVGVGSVLMVVGTIGVLGGCVNVAAPDKPIVIELNINIRQEVVYRLDAEAAKTIERNKDIF